MKRADQALCELGLAASLEEARLWILEGRVYMGAGKVAKPSDKVKKGLPITVRGEKRKYVSRGGYKLEKALDVFSVDVAGKTCIDIGASTGGFTDVLLQRGAKRVYAIDVGYGQLDYSLRADGRVVAMERTNARFLKPEMFDDAPSFGATDVSFISLKAILPAALSVLRGKDARFIALIKPQFEAAKEDVGAKGVVRDKNVHLSVVQTIVSFVREIGWCPAGLDFSPISGPEGNVEFLLDIQKAGKTLSETQIITVIDMAHDKFMKN
ncbi:MAG: TlyA family RNA methyltransferase [Christensenellales bacterium]